MKKILLFVILGLLICSPALAVQPLEVQYPAINLGPSMTPGPTSQTDLPNYARYVIIFLISISGLIALSVITIGGFEILTSAGDAGKHKEGLNRITAALVGSLIVFGFYIIISTINPNLLRFSLPTKQIILDRLAPGVYICIQGSGFAGTEIPNAFLLQQRTNPTERDLRQNESWMEKINKNCQYLLGSGNITGNFNDRVKWVYSVPFVSGSDKYYYGAILYEGEDFNKNMATASRTSIVYNPNLAQGSRVSYWEVDKIKASSIKPFLLNLNPSPQAYVALFQNPNHLPASPIQKMEASSYLRNYPSSSFITINKTLLPPPEGATSDPPQPKIGSMRIEGGKLIVFFLKKSVSSGWVVNDTIMDVYTEGDSNFEGNVMGTWCQYVDPKDSQTKNYPCAPGKMVILSASIL